MNSRDSHEQIRLNVLHSFEIIDTPPEAIFDHLAQLAARICEVPIAVVSLIDEQRQWFKAAVGLDVPETERTISFCTHTIRGKKPFIVPDARKDPRFCKNPLVIEEPRIRFYAGAPLISPSGFALGTLAVIDRVPRSMTDTQIASLEMLADQVMMHMELRRQHKQLENLAAERDRMNAALAHQAEHLREAQRIAEVGSWELYSETNRLICSEETYRILGIKGKNFKGSLDAFLSFVHAADRQHFREAHALALRGGKPLDLEHRIVRPDGAVCHVHERAELRFDEKGVAFLSGTMQDVTVRKKSQRQLHLLETCIARLNDIVMITEAQPCDEPGPRILFVNEAFERQTGYRREEVLGKSPRMLQGPKTQRAELDRIRAAIEKRQPICAELINYKKSGEEFWVALDITPVTTASGHPTHFVAVLRDITERKQRLQELAHTNRALQMLTRCNEALIRLENEQDLLEQICRIAIDVGGYRMAWVGYAQDDETRSVKPMARAGGARDSSYFDDVQLNWSEGNPLGNGPGGRAIRSGQAVVSEDIMQDPSFTPWLPLAQQHGYRGMICLPLRNRERTFGMLALHITEVRHVAAEEIKLLQELADNLAFGIGIIRSRQTQRRIEAAVTKVAAGVSASSGAEFFEQLALNMAQALRASAGFVAHFLPGDPTTIRTLSAVVDGKTVPNFDYVIEGTPCERFLHDAICIVPDKAGEKFHDSGPVAAFGAQAYVGRRLDNSAGQPLGLLCVLFREALTQVDFITSTLRIFATRAAGELERQESDARIREQASLLDKARDAIIVRGIDNRILFWNKGAERLYGWTKEDALGKTKMELLYEDATRFDEATNIVLATGEWRGEMIQRRKNGGSLTVEAHWTLVKDDEDKPQSILSINTDITQRKAAEQKIENLAFYDPLTRLPNRRLLLDRLQHALETANRNHHTGALLFIDLDNFKTLNDTLGHDKGDMLLQHVARRLESCVRRSNTVARLGGDEFIIMLEDLSEHAPEAAAQAEFVGEKILASFNRPFQLGTYEHHTTPSIGITLFHRQQNNVDDLLKRADLAMYQAKAAGRNAIRFFDPEMQNVVSARVALEADLRHGLQEHELYLHYQSQIDADGHMKGVEALVRWKHARRGLVSPAMFIPLAEETGLIMTLGHWVLKTACAQLAQWTTRPETARLSMAVNVSARQFRHPNFVNQVLTVLHETGADPQRLKLELTESLLVENVDDTITKMTSLKEKGVGFSLDDFGTGYSSLAYLKRLPLDQLKIDQSFVRDVLIDSNDAAIARTIVALGQILGLEVIAEGVETEEQRNFLARHGCRVYQGYLFGQPLPAEQF